MESPCETKEDSSVAFQQFNTSSEVFLWTCFDIKSLNTIQLLVDSLSSPKAPPLNDKTDVLSSKTLVSRPLREMGSNLYFEKMGFDIGNNIQDKLFGNSSFGPGDGRWKLPSSLR